MSEVRVCVWYLYTLQSYKKEGLQEEAQIHKIRITLTSRNVKSLEKGVAIWLFCFKLVSLARSTPSVVEGSWLVRLVSSVMV